MLVAKSGVGSEGKTIAYYVTLARANWGSISKTKRTLVRHNCDIANAIKPVKTEEDVKGHLCDCVILLAPTENVSHCATTITREFKTF